MSEGLRHEPRHAGDPPFPPEEPYRPEWEMSEACQADLDVLSRERAVLGDPRLRVTVPVVPTDSVGGGVGFAQAGNEPAGRLSLVGCEFIQKGHSAVFVTVRLQDEAGRVWLHRQSSSLFDLKPATTTDAGQQQRDEDASSAPATAPGSGFRIEGLEPADAWMGRALSSERKLEAAEQEIAQLRRSIEAMAAHNMRELLAGRRPV